MKKVNSFGSRGEKVWPLEISVSSLFSFSPTVLQQEATSNNNNSRGKACCHLLDIESTITELRTRY
tara:strand:+ start:383 stop:580 length:198 start_codon:yes stop_codon:yes gene_type:complete